MISQGPCQWGAGTGALRQMVVASRKSAAERGGNSSEDGQAAECRNRLGPNNRQLLSLCLLFNQNCFLHCAKAPIPFPEGRSWQPQRYKRCV
jgi:hypothetical protein